MFEKAWRHLLEDHKTLSSGIKILTFIIFFRALGWGFADPFFSIYMAQFSDNFALIGLLFSLMACTALLSIVPLLRLIDRMQETVVIRDGQILYLCVLLSYCLAGFFKNLPLLIFTLAVHGVAQTLVVVGTEAYIRKNDGKGKAGPFGYYVAMDHLGWVIGMFLGAFLIVHYGLNSMFLFVLPSVFLSFYLLPRIHEEGTRSFWVGLKHFFRSRQDVVDLFHDFRGFNPKMGFFLVLSFFDGAIRMFADVFIPLFGLSLNLSLKAIALLMVAMNLPFIFSYFFSAIADTVNKMTVITVSLFIGAFSFVMLHFVVGQWWILGLAALLSLSTAILRPAANGAVSRLAPPEKLGEVTGIYNLADRLGRIAGPLITGLIADQFGLPMTFLVMAVASLGLGLLAFAFRDYDLSVVPETALQ